MKIAAAGDLHCTVDSAGKVAELLSGVQEEADILLLAGDLTDRGIAEEMEVLLQDLSFFPMPIVAVAGNHDYEQDQIGLLINMMRSRGIHFLDNTTCAFGKVGFAGAKGLCGGFEDHRVQAHGDPALKAFVQASIHEAITLENALMELDTEYKVALLHYAPVRETVSGEAPELYPFLGSSLLGDVLDRHGVDAVVHAHAHHGSPMGATPRQAPVYNVARSVQSTYGSKPYFCFDIG